MSPTATVLLIAQREVNTKLRAKAFIISTAAIIALLAGYLLLHATVLSDSNRTKVALSGQATALASQIESSGAALGLDIEVSELAAPELASAALRANELDAVVSGHAAELRVMVMTALDPALREVLTSISRQEVLTAQLARSGVDDPAAVLDEANQVAVEVTTVVATDPDAEQRLVVAVVMVFLLFFGISSYGALVAHGVVEEKSSRVVEILLATVRPWHLLLGKVLGLGLVGLCQLVLISAVGLGTAIGTGVLTATGVGITTVAWGALWYVLGFLTYATIYAGAGALVSRQEEMRSVITPVLVVLMIGFVVGFTVLVTSPDGTAAQTLSMTPLVSPMLMPGRIAAGNVAGWEIALAIGLTVAIAALFTWLGGRIYSAAILRTGARVRLTEALRRS